MECKRNVENILGQNSLQAKTELRRSNTNDHYFFAAE